MNETDASRLAAGGGVVLTAPLDVENARDTLDRLRSLDLGGHVRLDCRAVARVDAAGAQILLALRRHLASRGGSLLIAGLPEGPRRLLATAGLGELVEILEPEAEAELATTALVPPAESAPGAGPAPSSSSAAAGAGGEETAAGADDDGNAADGAPDRVETERDDGEPSTEASPGLRAPRAEGAARATDAGTDARAPATEPDAGVEGRGHDGGVDGGEGRGHVDVDGLEGRGHDGVDGLEGATAVEAAERRRASSPGDVASSAPGAPSAPPKEVPSAPPDGTPASGGAPADRPVEGAGAASVERNPVDRGPPSNGRDECDPGASVVEASWPWGEPHDVAVVEREPAAGGAAPCDFIGPGAPTLRTTFAPATASAGLPPGMPAGGELARAAGACAPAGAERAAAAGDGAREGGGAGAAGVGAARDEG
jgi:anti-anti-sigma regulatory factor